MNWKILFVVGCVVLVLLLGLYASNKYHAQAAQIARSETEKVLAELEAVRAENAEIREILNRSYAAIQKANETLEKAHNGQVERNIKILDSDRDWLDQPLPDGVQDAFRMCAIGTPDPSAELINALYGAGADGDANE